MKYNRVIQTGISCLNHVPPASAPQKKHKKHFSGYSLLLEKAKILVCANRPCLILVPLLLYLSIFLLVIGLQSSSVFLISTLYQVPSWLWVLKQAALQPVMLLHSSLFLAYSLSLNLNIISQNSLPCSIDSVRVPQGFFLCLLQRKYLFKCLLFFDFPNQGINSMQWKTLSVL